MLKHFPTKPFQRKGSGNMQHSYRVGQGYDVHRLVEGRPLIIGGVTVPYERGLLGHSDADVLLHAVMDAMLGAAGLGDIGRHFPDNDAYYKGISSLKLLSEAARLTAESGGQPVNIDATVVAETPKLSPYREQMTANIAGAVGLTADCVNVKATTEEGLGFTGRGEGIAAYAVCMMCRRK
jgi:2-C-methyl-D-erythritol 2,4-cyclodiphosphate synthase